MKYLLVGVAHEPREVVKAVLEADYLPGVGVVVRVPGDKPGRVWRVATNGVGGDLCKKVHVECEPEVEALPAAFAVLAG